MKKQTMKPPTSLRRILIVASCSAIAVMTLVLMTYHFLNTPRGAADTVASIKSAIESKYYDVEVGDQPWQAEMASGRPTRVEGLEYSVLIDSQPTIVITQIDGAINAVSWYERLTRSERQSIYTNIEAVQTAITPKLIDAGFDVIAYDGMLQYIRNDNVCEYRSDAGSATFSCFDQASLRETADNSRPFVELYARATNTNIEILNVGKIVIKSLNGQGIVGPSQTPGYDIAEAVIMHDDRKYLVLYYQKENGNWRYATRAEDEFGFPCAELRANPDVREAFKGQICYEAERGQVRLDSNDPALD